MDITTKSEKKTFELGKKLGEKLRGGEVIALRGELGAGKTVFTRGVARGLGIKENITSPTFVIMKIYEVNHEHIKKLCHIDTYRVSGGEDLENIGALDHIRSPECATVIEWSDKAPGIIPKEAIRVSIEHAGGDKRNIKLDADEESHPELRELTE
jgi:tRNA threonylcarbamoyladenosine biosynthesis protein TsaE